MTWRATLACIAGWIWLAGLAGAVAGLNADQPVILLGGPLFESCPMMLMASDNLFGSMGRKTKFVAWRNPDQYRAMLTSGRADFVVVSTLEYRRLSQRRNDIELLFVVEGSPLRLIGRRSDIGLEDLRGQRIALPFRGDMPELMLGMLLRGSSIGMDDVSIVSAGGVIASAQLVMTGRADYAAVPEPIAAMMVDQSRRTHRATALHYALNLETAWRRRNPGGPPLLLSLIVAVGANDQATRCFKSHYPVYAEGCRNRPQRGARLFTKHFPVFSEDHICRFLVDAGVRIHPASEMAPELQRFFTMMAHVPDERR